MKNPFSFSGYLNKNFNAKLAVDFFLVWIFFALEHYVNGKPNEVQIKTILNSKSLLFCDNDAMEYLTVHKPQRVVSAPPRPTCLSHLPVGGGTHCVPFSLPTKSGVTLHLPSSLGLII